MRAKGCGLQVLPEHLLPRPNNIYWFGSTYDAMAYYQLHQAKNKDLRKAVFISTGGKPIGKQMREILDLTICPATYLFR